MKTTRTPIHLLKQLLLLFIISITQNGLYAQTWDEVITLAASDGASADLMGTAVAISGNKAIVSARRNDDAGNRSGSAYIFELVGGVWIETAKLTASDADEEDKFGNAVSISSTHAIVGAAENDDAGTSSGSAYIYELSGGVWTEVIKLTSSDAAIYDAFGRTVSISGTTAIVASTGDDDVGSGSGSVYVFELIGGIWTETVKLNASDAAASDAFGRSIIISDNRIVVGATGNDDDGASSGAAYIFEFSGGVWTEVAKLTASDGAEGDRFGISCSIDGDRALIGSDDDIYGGTNIGSAYIFDLIGVEWTEVAKLTASDEAEGDHFGTSVSVSGNLAIVGTYGNDDSGSGSGSAYVYSLSGGVWSENIKLTASDANTNDHFGVGVGLTGNTAIIGAQGHSGGGGPGAAYIFDGCPLLDLSATVDESSICLGDSVIFTAEGAEDVIWDLDVIDGVPFEPLAAGISTHMVTVIIDSTGCEYTSSVNLYVYDPTVVATVDDIEICLGDSVTFNGAGAVTYVWDMDVIDGAPFEPLVVGTETYTVIGSVDIGCADTANIDVTVYGLPEVTATVDESEICLGDLVTFNGDGAETYLWDLDVTDAVPFEPLTSGTETYTVIGMNEIGCADTATIDVTVNEIIISYTTLDEMFGADGSIDISVTGGTPAYTFDWDNDGTGDFDDDEDLTGLAGGTYTVVVEDEDGCSTTEIINLDSQLGIIESIDTRITVYPNPFSDYTTIYFGQELTENHMIIVYDILGQEVYRIENVTGTSVEIKKEQLGVGIYIVSLVNSDSEELYSTKLLVEA